MSVYKTRLNSGVNLLNIITPDSSHFKDSRNPRISVYVTEYRSKLRSLY